MVSLTSKVYCTALMLKSTDEPIVTDIHIYLCYFCLQRCYITTQHEMNVDHVLITLPTNTCLINKLFVRHYHLLEDSQNLYIFLLKKVN